MVRALQEFHQTYLQALPSHRSVAGGTRPENGATSRVIPGQETDDWLYGTDARDILLGGGGHDFIYAEPGNDIALGQDGNDFIYGQDGDDILIGGAGWDLLSGGRGNDTMLGGTGGDTYRFGYDVDNYGSMDDPGHDIIRETGEAPAWDDFDRIELFGYYGPSDDGSWDAYARLSFVRDGADMVMLSDGGLNSLTVVGQFAPGVRNAVEEVHFNAGYWTPLLFKILDGAKTDIDEDRAYNGVEGGEQNEILFGTDGADSVFGNAGTNFVWLGGGADTLIYKEADPQLYSGSGGGACYDIVEDFDLTEDVMDFSEIVGLTLAALDLSENAAGNAFIYWESGDFEVSDIFVELRGVDVADLNSDHFVFA